MSTKCRAAVMAAAVCLLGLSGSQARADDALVPASLIKDIKSWASTPVVLMTVKASNKRHAGITEPQILVLDKQWRAERKSTDQPLITSVVSSPLSGYLTRVQANSLGLISEIIVMDDVGLNAGQSDITTDFWQGDEAKFQKTFPKGAGALFIDKPEVEKDTGTERVQVNMTLDDGGTPVGAITVEINLTEMRRRQQAGKL